MKLIDLVVEVPEWNELAMGEPSVLEAHFDLDAVQDLLDFLQVRSDLTEKSALVRLGTVKDLLIYGHI